MKEKKKIKNVIVLSIGGSDPSSGAGIQNDVKTSVLLDAYCCTVVTAVTSQNTLEYLKTSTVLSPKAIKEQLQAIMSDVKIDVIKIGMVYDSKIIVTLHSMLKSLSIPIIVDPVLRSTTNGTLLKKGAVIQYKKKIVPLAHTITPNLAEAEILSGIKFQKKIDIEKIASKIIGMGAKNVIITGIPQGNKILDHVKTKSIKCDITSNKIKTLENNHGSGCTYSMALAVSIVKQGDIIKAAKFAKEFTVQSIMGAKKIGKGIKITDQGIPQDNIKKELSSGIVQFVQIKNIYRAIPECQTNLVFAKNKPKSIMDILGLSGRIVKAGKDAIVAGNLEWGGSKHVATAVLTVNKKFPKIRAGVNIKYDPRILDQLKRKKMKVLKYDRAQEPKNTKSIENSSVGWGVASAIAQGMHAPDVIYHTGDWGKEPMIILFGESPQNIIKKITQVSWDSIVEI